MSDPFDDHIRAKLGHSMNSRAGADAALNRMAPSLRRARRVAQVRTGVTGLAVVLACTGAIAAVVVGARDPEQSIVVATPSPESATTSVNTTVEAETSSSVDTSSVDSTDAPAASNDQAESTDTAGTAPTSSLPTTATTGAAATTVTSLTTGSSATSSSSTTSTTAAETSVVESVCGSIEVAIDGQNITLIASVAAAGFETDEKSHGPEKVEVSFEGPDSHCEIEAEVRDGVLWSDVDTE